MRNDVATRTAAAFTDMYTAHYPIRMMVLPDVFGHNPEGPGADDYGSMAADNTSGFNCRYVVGRERSRATSPHASGRALDLNTWENIYFSRVGPYPNSWYGRHPGAVHPAILRAGSPAVRALITRGFV